MPDLLDQLDRDHENLDALLTVLERQIDLLHRGQTPDYAIIDGVLAYCASYGDECHHPREDAVYEALEARGGATGEISRQLHAQHERLLGLTRAFSDAVSGVETGCVMRRTDLVEMGREFSRTYRDHMRMEEEFLFPRARETLTEQVRRELAARVVSRQDPVFGTPVEERYAALRRYLHGLDVGDRESRPPSR